MGLRLYETHKKKIFFLNYCYLSQIIRIATRSFKNDLFIIIPRNKCKITEYSYATQKTLKEASKP